MERCEKKKFSAIPYCISVLSVAFGLAFLSMYLHVPSKMGIMLIGIGVLIALILLAVSPHEQYVHTTSSEKIPQQPARRIGYIYLAVENCGYCHDSAFGDPSADGACMLLSAPFTLYQNDVVLLEQSESGDVCIVGHIPHNDLKPDEIAFLEANWGPTWRNVK